MILQPMGRTATPCYQVCGELLPRLFTLTPCGAVFFCYVNLNVAAYRLLTGMEPCVARTFLSRVSERQTGLLRAQRYAKLFKMNVNGIQNFNSLPLF